MIQVTNIIVVTTAHSILRDTTDNFNFNFNVFVTHLCTNKTYSATSQKFKAPAEDTVQSAPFPFEPHKTLKFKYVWRSVIRIRFQEFVGPTSYFGIPFWPNSVRICLYLNSPKQNSRKTIFRHREHNTILYTQGYRSSGISCGKYILYAKVHGFQLFLGGCRTPILKLTHSWHPTIAEGLDVKIRGSQFKLPRVLVLKFKTKIPMSTYTCTQINLWILFLGS